MHYSLSRATLWNLAGYSYLLLASFLTLPRIISSLGIEVFGEYALIIATITLASSIDLGLSAAAIRALAREEAKNHHHIWASSHLLFIAIGLVAASLSSLVVSFLYPHHSILPLVFAHTFAGHLLTHYLTLPQAHGRFDLYNLRPFVVGTANTFLTALLASLSLSLDNILAAQLLATLVTILILALYTAGHFGHFPARASLAHSQSLLTFGVKNQLGKLVNQVGAQYGKFLLSAISPLAVAAYTVAQNLVTKAAGGITQLSTALYPASSRQAGSRKLRSLYYRLQLVLLITSFLGLGLYHYFGRTFLLWWLGDPELAGAVHTILTLLLPYLAILVLTPLPSIILDSHNRPGLTSLFVSLAVGLEIFLALLLLPIYGLLAPARAALISMLITTPILLFATDRVLAVKIKLA